MLTKPGSPPQFTNITQKIEQKLKMASNHPPIAKEADLILSKLIKAKSPVVLSWLQKRNLLKELDEKIAREWRKYYLENFIFYRYPVKNKKVNQYIEKLFDDINKISFSERFKSKSKKLFESAQDDALKVIQAWNLEEKDKKTLLKRVEDIRLYWFHKLQHTKYEKIPLEFVRWGVAYDPATNEINMGIQSLQYANDSTLYSVFAHEIGHAFDPCRWQPFLQSQVPYQKLITCLRSNKSTAAKKRDDSKMKEMLAKKQLSVREAQGMKLNPLCNRSFYPPVGTQQEQILEVFADWFATEVIAISKHLNGNMRTDLCRKK